MLEHGLGRFASNEHRPSPEHNATPIDFGRIRVEARKGWLERLLEAVRRR